MAEIWGAAVGAVVGAGASLYGSSQASKGQQNAADAATQEQQRQFDLTRNDQAPYRQAGSNALAQLVNLAPQFGQMPTAASVTADPGYQFGLTQGTNALQSSAAAAGGLYSGAAAKALTQYGNDYGTTKYDDAFNRQQTAEGNTWNRYSGLAGLGQTATQQTDATGQQTANNIGNISMNNANAQGAAAIANGNIWGKAAGQIGSYGQQGTFGAPSTAAGWFGYGAAQNPSTGQVSYAPSTTDDSWQFAEGGPVQLDANGVPIVGSRSAVRSGGGGALSKNALALLLAAPAQAASAPQPQPAPQLPANFLMNPQAVLDARMRAAGQYAAGGPIHGPGGPKDDMIPARLSDGEHVFDTASVTALGGGNNAAGQMKLNKLRALLHGSQHA